MDRERPRPGCGSPATEDGAADAGGAVRAGELAEVGALLREHGGPLVDEVPNAVRFSMACPATPTCGLAVAESERALPDAVRQVEAILREVGLADERCGIRRT